MTDNEKAAIAAGLWEPPTICECGAFRPAPTHTCANCGGVPQEIVESAPNMHLPENLWRALEQLMAEGVEINGSPGPNARDRLFAALVALYDAEHPESAPKH